MRISRGAGGQLRFRGLGIAAPHRPHSTSPDAENRLGFRYLRLALPDREPYFFYMIVGQPIPFEARTKLRIPLASATVQAGFPSPAEDHMENSLDLNEHLVSNPAATFFVRVQGNSMRDAGIQGGDILVVDRSITPGDRQIVIAMLDGEFTVKRLRKRGGRIFLEAENPDFAPIEISDSQELTIWGAVTFVIHPAR